MEEPTTSHRYQCPTCNKGFDVYTTYYCHKKRHDAPSKQCSFCPKAFHTNMLLNAHLWKCAKAQAPSNPPATVGTAAITNEHPAPVIPVIPVAMQPAPPRLMPSLFASSLY